jgi:hypothetical protein
MPRNQKNRKSRKGLRHGISMSVEGTALRNMISRCTDPRHVSYKDYGGRGIRVCDDWTFGRDGQSKYQAFVADVGLRPSPLHTIDRINNEGNYEPGNCCWETRLAQARNKRNNKFFTHDGQTQILADWARSTGLGEGTIRRRLDRGWPIERALTAPPTPTIRSAA